MSTMRPMYTRAFKIALIAAVGFCIASLATAADYTWPERGSDPYPWPMPKGATSAKIVHDRFAQASTNTLGTLSDIAAIKQTIETHKSPARVEVRELRWLSPSLVMAYTRTESAAFYYVAEKKKDKWSVLTYYLIWVK